MSNWSGFWRLTGFERGLVMESATSLMATWAGLRLLGFRRWKRFLGWLSPAEQTTECAATAEQMSFAHLIAKREESAARHLFYQPNCLEQSLTLWWLLRLRSIPSEIRIGGRRTEDRFEAHAWIECGGEVLSSGGEGHLHFIPFDEPIPDWETSVH